MNLGKNIRKKFTRFVNEVLLLFLSVNSFSSAAIGQQVDSSLLQYLQKEGKNPKEYIIDKFKKYDVIFLGEHHMIKQNLEFVQDLLPELYNNGIYYLGMEFGASEDQEILDTLVTGKNYNEQLAKRIMFNYNVTWAYKEYIDIYKKVWELNQKLPEDAIKFRILNLSYKFNWEGFRGKRTPEKMKKVFYKGTIDKYRADLIENKILLKHHKMLALVGTPHAFTKYALPIFRANSEDFCTYDNEWLGNRLYAKYPAKIYSIILHQGFYNLPGELPFLISPGNGKIERLMLLNNNKATGFDLINSPIGGIRDNSGYSMCYEDFTLAQLFDGYIFLKPLDELECCTVIEDFVNEENIKEALRNFPDPDWHEKVKNLGEMETFIKNNAERAIAGYKSM